MLELTEITTWLNEKFNAAGQINVPIYTFNINAEIGKNKGENVVNGVLISETPKITPIPNIKDYKYKLRVTLSVTAPTANNNLKNVEKIVGAVAEEYNGKEIQFDNGKGIVTFTLTGTKDFKVEAGQGGIVPLTFYLDINYTEGLVTSATKHWLLNDMEIPFQSESVIIEKNGKINPINDRKYQQVFMTTQLKWYHFRFPFVNSDLCNMLYKDMLEGDMNKKYTLKYYDGVSYTQANPYTTKVVIFRNGDGDSQRPDTAMFDIMFSDADDGLNKTKYELALIDNAFDGSTENTRWFDSEEEQRLWYDTKIKILTPSTYNEIPAPNLNSLILTNQVYQNTSYFDYGVSTYSNAVAQGYYYRVGYDKYGYTYDLVANITEEEFNTYISGGGICYYEAHLSVFDLTNRNYAVIRVSTEDFYRFNKPATRLSAVQLELFYQTAGQYKPVSELTDAQYASLTYVYTNKRYFYYRVANANIGANNQVIYDLQLDEVQTYLFQSNINIQGSFISKAHLDRWLYSYELVNATVLEKPSQADCLAYGYYKKTPDTNTIGSADTFELITSSNYASTNYAYEMVLTFNGKADSKLFEREDLRELSKRLVYREKLQYKNLYNTDSYYTLVTPKPAYSSLTINKYFYKVGNEYKEADQYSLTEEQYASINNVYTNKYRSFVTNINKVPFWVYIFIDGNNPIVTGADALKYKIHDKDGHLVEEPINLAYSGSIDKVNLTTAILCFPVNEWFSIDDYGSGSVTVGMQGWLQFIKNNDDILSDKCKGVKISVRPPFDLGNLYDYNWVDDKIQPYDNTQNILSLSKYSNVKNLSVIRTGLGTLEFGLFLIETEYNNPIIMEVQNPIAKLSFKKSEIVGKNRDKKFNPKMNEQDYRSLNLTINGNAYEMPINKINEEYVDFEYFEQLTPESTKGLLRLHNVTGADVNAVFNPYYSSSFNGFNYQDNFTIAIAYSAYSQYIASNKNAYEQLNAQLTYNENSMLLTNKYAMIKGGVNAVSGVAKSATDLGMAFLDPTKIGSAITGMVDAVKGVADTAIDIGERRERLELGNDYEKTKFDFSIDNMKNAPSTIRNINGNAILTNMIAEFGIYAEIFEGLDTELESANDVMFRDGYNLNRFEEAGKTVKDYCHTRKYFNYVRATLGNISGIPMSDKMRSALRQRFANGIRFWHQDTIDYSKENYELKIEQ